MNALVRVAMKTVANCDMQCELWNSESRQRVESKQHLGPHKVCLVRSFNTIISHTVFRMVKGVLRVYLLRTNLSLVNHALDFWIADGLTRDIVITIVCNTTRSQVDAPTELKHISK